MTGEKGFAAWPDRCLAIDGAKKHNQLNLVLLSIKGLDLSEIVLDMFEWKHHNQLLAVVGIFGNLPGIRVSTGWITGWPGKVVACCIGRVFNDSKLKLEQKADNQLLAVVDLPRNCWQNLFDFKRHRNTALGKPSFCFYNNFFSKVLGFTKGSRKKKTFFLRSGWP